MSAISTTQDGTCAGPIDVCKVPPNGALVPMLNVAYCCHATNTAATVFAVNKPALTIASSIDMSFGDEAGTMGGVKSGMFISVCTYRTSSARVYANNRKVVMHECATAHNGRLSNCGGFQVTPSQGAVFAMS